MPRAILPWGNPSHSHFNSSRLIVVSVSRPYVCVLVFGHTAMNVNVDNNCSLSVTFKSNYFKEDISGLQNYNEQEGALAFRDFKAPSTI
jgi:hypothetical protein